jgi:lysyl-tRNA synthetase class I
LDAVDHLCLQVEDDPEVQRHFYLANTPEQIVHLSLDLGILIDAEDFRALLRSGTTERWYVRGGDQTNPITHLKRVFRV